VGSTRQFCCTTSKEFVSKLFSKHVLCQNQPFFDLRDALETILKLEKNTHKFNRIGQFEWHFVVLSKVIVRVNPLISNSNSHQFDLMIRTIPLGLMSL
jgi:hypothetical protein